MPDYLADEGTVVLVNAMSRRDVYILHKGKPKKLPKAHPPVFIEDSHYIGELEVATLSKKSRKKLSNKRSSAIKVTSASDKSRPFILNDLPELDSVLYLVEPEVLARFPYRKDFVIPSTYQSWYPRKWRKPLKSKNKKTRMRARKKAIKEVPFEKRFPLASIQHGPLVAATPETPRLPFG